MQKRFYYETHVHTCESSKCGKSSGAEVARFYKSLGYTGIFVTDHFLNGNTTVPKELPWEERIDLFCRGYRCARDAGEAIGLKVFFGWEYSYGWCHLPTYGLGPSFLKAHPDLLDLSVTEYLDLVHREGGFVVHAHPFRDKIRLVQLLPDDIDAVEVCNAQQSDLANHRAELYAQMLSLPRTAGSDLHLVTQRRLAGVASEVPFSDAADYATALRQGSLKLFTCTDGVFSTEGDPTRHG